MVREENLKALEGRSSEPFEDDRPPLTSPVTLQVAFALAVGYRFFASDSFLDATEELADGTFKRSVVWGFDAAHTVEFQGEPWTVKYFREHLIDPEWRDARPKHPVAKLGGHYANAVVQKPSQRADFLMDCAFRKSDWLGNTLVRASETYTGYRWKIRAGLAGNIPPHPEYKDPLERHIIIRKGLSRAYIPMNATAEERAEELARYGIS